MSQNDTKDLGARSKNIDNALADIDAKAANATGPIEADIKSSVDDDTNSVKDGSDIFAEQLLEILSSAKYDDSGFNKVRAFAQIHKAKLSRNFRGVFCFIPTSELEDTVVEIDDDNTVTIDPIGVTIDLLTEPANGVPDQFFSIADRATQVVTKTFHKAVPGWPAHPDGDDFGDWDYADFGDISRKVGIEYLKGASFAGKEDYLNMNVFDSCPVPPKLAFDFSESDLDVILTSMKSKIADKGAATINMTAFLELLDETIVDKNPGAKTIAELKVMKSNLDNLESISSATTAYFTSATSWMSNFRDYIMKIRNTVKSNEGGMEISKYSDETSWIDRMWDRETKNYKPGILKNSEFIKTDAFVIQTFIKLYKVAIDLEIVVRGNFLALFFDDLKTNTLLAKSHADLLNMYNNWKDDVAAMQEQFKNTLTEIQDANAALIEDIRKDYGEVIGELKDLVKSYDASLKKSNKLLVDYGNRLGSFTKAEIERQVQEGIRLRSSSDTLNGKSDILAKRKYEIDPSLYNRKLHSSIKQDINAQKEQLTSKWKLDNANGKLKTWVLAGAVTGVATILGTAVFLVKKKKRSDLNSGGYNGSQF